MDNFHTFSFNGKLLSEFGAVITQRPVYTISVRDLSFIQLPHRSGDYVRDNGRFQNISVEFPIRAVPSFCDMSIRDFSYSLSEWLYTNEYKEYRDTYNPGYFRKGVCTEIGDITAVFKDVFETRLKFNFDPFLYYDSGIEPLHFDSESEVIKFSLIDTDIYNPENVVSLPQIIIDKKGIYDLGVITDNITYTATVTVPDGGLIIDKMTENIYNINGDSLNENYNGWEIPAFSSGKNHLRIAREDGEKIEPFGVDIIPNWRRL